MFTLGSVDFLRLTSDFDTKFHWSIVSNGASPTHFHKQLQCNVDWPIYIVDSFTFPDQVTFVPDEA
jgi:hypothetical protein